MSGKEQRQPQGSVGSECSPVCPGKNFDSSTGWVIWNNILPTWQPHNRARTARLHKVPAMNALGGRRCALPPTPLQPFFFLGCLLARQRQQQTTAFFQQTNNKQATNNKQEQKAQEPTVRLKVCQFQQRMHWGEAMRPPPKPPSSLFILFRLPPRTATTTTRTTTSLFSTDNKQTTNNEQQTTNKDRKLKNQQYG